MTERGGGQALPRRALFALSLVSAASIGAEIALTRYFAVAKWSEYGYWVISIVLAGFALSGVLVALARDWFARTGPLWLAVLPAALIAAGAGGFWLATVNPFNPLLLQNAATLGPQLCWIGLYYVELLPFFLLTGLFVSLSFVLGVPRVGRVYAFDLAGAGAGAAGVLGLMWVVHPFALMPCLLPVLAVAAALAPERRRAATLAAALALIAGEVLLLGAPRAAFNDFKAIYAPLHTPDAAVLAERRSPRGLAMLLGDFTERVDTDVSNDASALGLPGPPTTLGLYRDGNRVTALAKPDGLDVGYAGATLAALPYALLASPRVLLAGSSGGFRVEEALALGARQVDAAESDPDVRRALRRGLGPSPPLPPLPRARVRPDSVLALARPGHYDLVDVSGDFLDAAPANTNAFTVEALGRFLDAVAPSGLVSIPVGIREFPAYAVRMLATVRAALAARGVAHPAAHVLVVRSAWTVRILASPSPIPDAWVAAARGWADARSFDVSWYPGMDPGAARAGIYNDLPAVSFETASVTSAGDGPHDAIADEAGAVLAGQPTASAGAFDLSPITLDRPAFYAVLRLSGIGTILRRLELLPQAEVGPIVNLVVLAQSVLLAALVLGVPWIAGARLRAVPRVAGAAAVYFACLGLGFLFIEIVAIERASLYLDDRTSGFALVLTGMLLSSGAGALLADRLAPSRRVIAGVLLAVLVWGALVLAFLQPALLASLGWPWPVRALLVLLAVAPVSVALGVPFPLGLARLAPRGGGFLPWAWAINGAFSVMATPLANLLAQVQGYDRMLTVALILYGIAAASLPAAPSPEARISP